MALVEDASDTWYHINSRVVTKWRMPRPQRLNLDKKSSSSWRSARQKKTDVAGLVIETSRIVLVCAVAMLQENRRGLTSRVEMLIQSRSSSCKYRQRILFSSLGQTAASHDASNKETPLTSSGHSTEKDFIAVGCLLPENRCSLASRQRPTMRLPTPRIQGAIPSFNYSWKGCL